MVSWWLCSLVILQVILPNNSIFWGWSWMITDPKHSKKYGGSSWGACLPANLAWIILGVGICTRCCAWHPMTWAMGSYWRNTSHLFSAMWSQRLWVLQVGGVAWKSAASRVFHQPVFLRSFGFGNEAVKQWPKKMLVPVVPTHLKTWPNHPRWSWNKQTILESWNMLKHVY